MERAKRLILCLAAVWLLVGAVLTTAGARTEKTADYSLKIKAANLMGEWMDAVKEMKSQAGLELETRPPSEPPATRIWPL